MRMHVPGRSRSTRFWSAVTVMVAVIAWMVIGPAAAGAATVTLKFESQALDLDTGLVVPWALKRPPGSEIAEVYMAYNSERMPHAVVALTGGGLEIGIASGLSFDMMTAQVAAAMTYSGCKLDLPFSAEDTVVIKTAGGAVYKLGRAIETDDAVSFEYELLFVQ